MNYRFEIEVGDDGSGDTLTIRAINEKAAREQVLESDMMIIHPTWQIISVTQK